VSTLSGVIAVNECHEKDECEKECAEKCATECHEKCDVKCGDKKKLR